MKRYIALLRGVNISGRNKVPMAELKLGFESLGFSDVRTWLNSGNVVFSGEKAEAAALTGQIEGMIRREFGLDIPVFLMPQEELADILRHAPDWWGTEDPEIYDNLIFILPPASFQDVYREIGAPKLQNVLSSLAAGFKEIASAALSAGKTVAKGFLSAAGSGLKRLVSLAGRAGKASAGDPAWLSA